MAYKYSEEELQFIRDNYLKLGSEETARHLGKTKKAIEAKAQRMGILRPVAEEFTLEEEEFLKDLYGDVPVQDLAKALGRTLGAVHRKARRMGIQGIRGRDWSALETRMVQELYLKVSIKDLARTLGRSKMEVHKKIHRLGLSLRDQRPKTNFFFTEWTEEMAYILGFWMADGSMRESDKGYDVRFGTNDGSLLKKIAAAIGYDHYYLNPDKKGCWHLVYSSKELFNDLWALGCRPKKTGNEIIPEEIPDNMVRHFIRGEVDGDGSLWWRKNKSSRVPGFSLIGGEDYLTKISGFIFYLTGLCVGNPRVISHCDKVKSLGRSAYWVKLLAWWLYHDAKICLDRKLRIAQEFWDWTPKRWTNTRIPRKMYEMVKDVFPEDMEAIKARGGIIE